MQSHTILNIFYKGQFLLVLCVDDIKLKDLLQVDDNYNNISPNEITTKIL